MEATQATATASPLAELDLSKFCDPDSSRYALQQPWRVDGFIYASDGRVAARIPDDGRELVIVEGRKPDCRQIFEPYFSQVVEWQSPPELVPCVDCVAGEVPKECRDCDGRGRVPCKNECDDNCPTCEGERTVKSNCEKCCVVLGNRLFYRKFLFLFLSIPGLQWGLCPKSSDDEMGPVYFCGDGGFAGIAMPRRKDD